jgi:D-threo-aldose 1-dehydrogenase
MAPGVLTAARLGSTSLSVTALGFGGAPLGGLFTAVSEEAAAAALAAAWDAGVRYFDTAPLYGFGLSEQRMGAFLRTKPRDEYVLSTKVGRLLRPTRGAGDTGGSLGAFVGALPNDAIFDFSADAVRRSLEQSLTRLGLDRIDIAYLHDPDDFFDAALGEAYPVLRGLREEGVLRAIGAGMNQWQMLAQFVERCDLDAVLLAGRYTLLDRSAEATFLPLCAARDVAVIAGGVFNSGILARTEPAYDATYNYVPASPALLARARAMARACSLHGTTLPAAALQFPLRNAAIAGVLAGMRDAAEVNANAGAFGTSLPAALWAEIDRIAAS